MSDTTKTAGIERFLRIATDSKYQFSVGAIAALHWADDHHMRMCIVAIAIVTIIAEGMRDFAKWLPVSRPHDPVEPNVNLDVDPAKGATTTTIKTEPGVTPPVDHPYGRVGQ